MATGIVSALPAEAQPLTRRMPEPLSSHTLPPDTRVQLSGVGADRAARAASKLVQQGATALLSWGIAGALSTELRSGNVVLPETVVSEAGSSFTADPDWHQRVMQQILPVMPCRIGRLYCSNEIVATTQAKQVIARESAAVAVDMESCAVAEVAQQAGLPFLAIRVILDSAAQGIPVTAQQAIDEDGRATQRRMLQSLARRPADLPALMGLARSLRLARSTLKRLSGLLSPSFGL